MAAKRHKKHKNELIRSGDFLLSFLCLFAAILFFRSV